MDTSSERPVGTTDLVTKIYKTVICTGNAVNLVRYILTTFYKDVKYEQILELLVTLCSQHSHNCSSSCEGFNLQ